MRTSQTRGPRAAFTLQPWSRLSELAVDQSAYAIGQLRLLAVPALVRRDGHLVPLERKDAALLALLALDGPLLRERAAALLWPDAPDPQKARNSLRQRLFRLRRAAGFDLVRQGGTLSLAAQVASDLSDIAARIADDPDAAVGELLGGFGYDDCEELDAWVASARARLRAERRDALAAAAAREEAAGHVARALLLAERLVGEDRLSEQAHRMLMRLHYRRGDRAAALAAHARCRLVLKHELGAGPSAETNELAQLIERSGALPGSVARPLPAAITRPPLLVGREREWRMLEDAWNNGRIALLKGDAGMGKTRLLADFAQSRAVPVVGARPGDERVPYALLARVLRAALPGESQRRTAVRAPAAAVELARILPELGPVPEGPLQEARFRQAVARALEDCRDGGLPGVALDDLHFADPASLELLPTLALSGLRWALALRGGETPAPIAAWERAEEASSIVAIALPPLSESDVRSLLESLALEGVDSARLSAPIARHTGGNPFFVLQTVGALVTQPLPDGGSLPTPPTVGALIDRRLGQLSPAALRLARVAALAGVDFSAELAGHVLQAHPLDLAGAWSELEQAQVLRGDGFAHDIVRDVALRSVPAPIGELLHRAIADYLVERHAAPARIARHFEEARLWPRAAAFHLAAADAAQRASRRAEEADHREAAAACFDQAGDADAAFDARCASVECLILVRGVERTLQVIARMLDAARTDAQRTSALSARANAALMAADHVTGVASAREALSLAEQQSLPWGIAFEASRLLAVGLSQQGRAEEAEAVLGPFASRILAEGSPEQRGRYWADLAYVLNSGRRLRRTADALGHAIACARERGDLAELASLTSNFATVHGNLGHLAQAHEHALRALALQAEIGDTGGPTGGVVESHVGLYGTALGRYGGALQAFDRALACFGRDGQSVWTAVCSNNLAVTWIDLGQYARARKTLDYAAPSVRHVAARGAMLAARVARLLGASPIAELKRARAALAAGPDYYIGALLDLEEIHSLPSAEALQRCDSVRDAADRSEFGGIAMKARLLGAQAALLANDPASALARWNEIEALPATLQAADSYPLLASRIGHDILGANGEAERAAALLRAAVAWIEESALPHVPEAFRESFLHRNPVNRSLLTAATRLR